MSGVIIGLNVQMFPIWPELDLDIRTSHPKFQHSSALVKYIALPDPCLLSAHARFALHQSTFTSLITLYPNVTGIPLIVFCVVDDQPPVYIIRICLFRQPEWPIVLLNGSILRKIKLFCSSSTYHLRIRRFQAMEIRRRALPADYILKVILSPPKTSSYGLE